MNLLNEPTNDKETRNIEKFLLFPKRLNTLTRILNRDYTKEIRWLKKVKIRQIARPHFYADGLTIILTRFSWQDHSFIED